MERLAAPLPDERDRSMNDLERLVEDFCDRSEVAPATRRAYRNSLVGIFLPWADAEGLTDPEQLTPDAIDRFARDLEARTTKAGKLLAVPTRRTYLRAVRQLVGWLTKRKRVQGLDATAVPMPRLRRKDRDVLSPAEMQALEDAAKLERDKLIVRVMADLGAREGEIAAIRVSDIIERDRRYYFLRLRGKTGERLAPIRPALCRRLQAYAQGKTGRPMRSGYDILFMAHRKRNQGGYEPLTADGIYQVVKDAAERSGMTKRIYPHLLRHSAITHMVATGMNLVTVSEIVGASLPVIAQHYTHQSDEQRFAAMMKVLEE